MSAFFLINIKYAVEKFSFFFVKNFEIFYKKFENFKERNE